MSDGKQATSTAAAGAVAPAKPTMRQRVLIGPAESMIVFITIEKDVAVRDSRTGEKVLMKSPKDVDIKLTSAPIGGYTAGGGCAFTLTERWCARHKITFDEAVENIKSRENYGFRFVFLDDDTKDEHGDPRYKRIMDQIKHRHKTEKFVQNEALEQGVMNSDNVV